MVLWAALPVAVLGRIVSGRLGTRILLGWRLLWLGSIAGLWLWLTGSHLARSSVLVFAFTALSPLRLPALSTTLLLGGLAMVGRALRAGEREAEPMGLLLPGWVALTLALNPAAAEMTGLPLLLAAGAWPPDIASTSRLSEQAEQWRIAPALFIEMASMQCVAWGLVMAVLSFALEIRLDWLSALVVSSGVGVFAWLLSGLLWGFGQAVREGRIPLGRWLARMLSGH